MAREDSLHGNRAALPPGPITPGGITPAPITPGSVIPTAVLDTNVVLDCFAFDGPLALPLADAIRAGAMQILTTEECLAELARVLAYPKLKLTSAERETGLSHFKAVAQVVPARRVGNVPPCRDRDDQKFLNLAAAERVQFLFSRDARVLATRAQMLRIFAVTVIEPRMLSGQELAAGLTIASSGLNCGR